MRLVIICHGAIGAQREGRFPLPDDPLVPGDAPAVGELAPHGGAVTAVCAPEQRARETAVLLGLAATVDERLRDCDYGAWAGKPLAEIAAGEPELLASWTQDASARPPHGEPFVEVVARMAAWLDGLPRTAGTVVAVTHPAVVRAAICHALDLQPLKRAFGFDVQPLARIVLTHDGRRWKLRLDPHPPAPAPGRAGRAGV